MNCALAVGPYLSSYPTVVSNHMLRRALITGISGQDGGYLARLLLGRGYEVHGSVRRADDARNERLVQIADRVALHQADLMDQSSIVSVLSEVRPHEVYNLAAQ